jgi:transposase-like protein
VNPGVIQRWKSDPQLCHELGLPGGEEPSVPASEVRQLRRDLSTARQERDILKKALGYFAKEKN